LRGKNAAATEKLLLTLMRDQFTLAFVQNQRWSRHLLHGNQVFNCVYNQSLSRMV